MPENEGAVGPVLQEDAKVNELLVAHVIAFLKKRLHSRLHLLNQNAFIDRFLRKRRNIRQRRRVRGGRRRGTFLFLRFGADGGEFFQALSSDRPHLQEEGTSRRRHTEGQDRESEKESEKLSGRGRQGGQGGLRGAGRCLVDRRRQSVPPPDSYCVHCMQERPTDTCQDRNN